MLSKLSGLVDVLHGFGYSPTMSFDVIADTAERAVRNYLLFLEDPQKLIDSEQIAGLTARARDATDPIERLKLYGELERAQSTDGSRFRLDFVLHAKAWAAANHIGPSAFSRLGVPDDVLHSAGLLRGRPTTGKSSGKRDVATRASITTDVVKRHVRSLSGTFTMADVQARVGGSPMTIRKGVQALVDDGTIARLGPMREWNGRGRAPIVFEVRASR